jgi:hypothetical protein
MRKFIASLSIIFAAIGFLPLTAIPVSAAVSPTATICSVPLHDLKAGASSSEVKTLQIFLNSHGSVIASSGVGSPGQESAYFGAKTKIALSRFQKAQAIIPASGIFGPLTRARAAALCNPVSGNGSQNQLAPVQAVTPPAIQGFGGGNGLTAPVVPLPPQTSTINPPAAQIAPASAAIPSASIVGILCYLNYRNQLYPLKASGVVINPEGYILTARHAVDPQFTAMAYADTLTAEQTDFYSNATFDHCEAGMPENTTLPGSTDIRNSNPAASITSHFQYETSLQFVPAADGMDTEEYKNADFAVLKITAAAFDCARWNAACGMSSFAYSPAGSALPKAGVDEVLSYGYPAEAINQSGSSFYDFYLKGAVGTVGNYFRGAQKFANDPENFSFEAADIRGGRSGSAVFANGRIIGILYGSTSSQESYNVTITAIRSLLADKGLAWILENN